MNHLKWLPCLLILGCGDTTDDVLDAGKVDLHDGVYEVTNNTLNLAGCQTSGDEIFGDPYFMLIEGDNGGVDYYTCRSPTDCNDYTEDLKSFGEAKENSFVGTHSWYSYSEYDQTCGLFLRKNKVKFDDDGTAHITRFDCQEYYEAFSESACADMEDPDMSCTESSSTCINLEEIDGFPY
jgi:hypothetical protein